MQHLEGRDRVNADYDVAGLTEYVGIFCRHQTKAYLVSLEGWSAVLRVYMRLLVTMAMSLREMNVGRLHCATLMTSNDSILVKLSRYFFTTMANGI